MTEGFCDVPPPLYSIFSTPSLLKSASPVQSSFPSMPITSVTMTSTLLASTPLASTPMALTSLTFVPMTSTPLASVPMTFTSNAPTSLIFSQIASTLLASTTIASCTPITLYGSPPPLQSIHPTNLSMPYSPFVYAPLNSTYT